jgi:ATP-dependent DNA ligase
VTRTGSLARVDVRWHGLEGIVAKRLDSRYQHGKRTEAWIKIKPGREARC